MEQVTYISTRGILRKLITLLPLALARGAGGKAKACILVYLLGGPPHLDMFDLKPEAGLADVVPAGAGMACSASDVEERSRHSR